MSAAWSFSARPCPCCGQDDAVVLIDVRPADVCASNWSFRPALAAELQAAPATLPIVRCRACGFAYARLLPNDAFLSWAYDELIDADIVRADNLGHAAMAHKLAPLRSWLALLPNVQPVRVLDVGCGFGPVLRLLHAMTSLRALGFETSAERMRQLAADGLPATGDWDAVVAKAPFDGVVLDNVLEHVAQPLELLRRVRAVCAPGAAVFVSVPDLGAGALAAIAVRRAAGEALPMEVNPWEHLGYFDGEHLDGFMRRAGFEPVPASQRPGPVDIGLRPSPHAASRIRNAAASAVRMARYAFTGDAPASPTARFYLAVAAQ